MSTPNAEPKGTPPLDDAQGARKSSKKSSSKRSVDGGPPVTTPSPAISQLSSAAPTSPVPALHDVPRLAIADPKGVEGPTDPSGGKVRASKKRTSTPENVAPGPSLPPTTDGPPAAAKSEADAEKERAKREAKKQRARELEEQRKREELERLALDEARRKEEQMQREQRRLQEQARLNANADVVQDEEDDGYGDDGFEDYGDDFETDDAPLASARAKPSATPAKPLAKAKAVPRDADAAVLDSVELKRIQEAQKAESKELATTSRPSSKSSSKGDGTPQAKLSAAGGAKKSPASSIAASIAGLKQTLDPRAKRAKEIREVRRLDVEKFNVFVQAPMAEVDIYLARLRRGNVRQVAVQTKDDDKSVATQTRVPELVDRSMHFPDDVGVDDVPTRLAGRGKRRGGDNQTEPSDDADAEESNDDQEAATMSSMRFLNFLEQSSQVCEQLIQENIQDHEAQAMEAAQRGTSMAQISQNATFSRQQLFPTKSFEASGLEKLLQGRSLTAMEFSPGMSNILVTWHSPIPTPESESSGDEQSQATASQADSLLNKSVACVWNTSRLSQAMYMLRSEDVVTTCSLSPSRDLIVLAGTQDGSVNVWDLRNRLSLAGRKYSAEYEMDLYSPTYSTCAADSRSVEGSHKAPIVSIHVVERQSGNSQGSGIFQFGSLDDRGLLLIWSMIDLSNTRDADTLLNDKCLAIGGHIKLVASVAIDTQVQYLVLTRPCLAKLVRRDPNCLLELVRARKEEENPSGNNRRGSFGSGSSNKKKVEEAFDAEPSVGPVAIVLKFFPTDPNQFLIGTTTGIVICGNRFQQSTTTTEHGVGPHADCYRRDHHKSVAAPLPIGIAVTCIAFYPFDSNYFLVGYEDGRICLFEIGLTAAISTWEDVEYDKSVTSLHWSPSRPGVFFASYSHGLVHVWDLTTKRHAPAYEHKLAPLKEPRLVAYPIALSSERMRTSPPSIAICCGDAEPFGFQVHELGPDFTTRGKDEARVVQQILRSIF